MVLVVACFCPIRGKQSVVTLVVIFPVSRKLGEQSMMTFVMAFTWKGKMMLIICSMVLVVLHVVHAVMISLIATVAFIMQSSLFLVFAFFLAPTIFFVPAFFEFAIFGRRAVMVSKSEPFQKASTLIMICSLVMLISPSVGFVTAVLRFMFSPFVLAILGLSSGWIG